MGTLPRSTRNSPCRRSSRIITRRLGWDSAPPSSPPPTSPSTLRMLNRQVALAAQASYNSVTRCRGVASLRPCATEPIPGEPMTAHDIIRTMIDYHVSTNRHLWGVIQRNLTDAQFAQDLGYSWGSIRSVMAHMVSVDRWRVNNVLER